MLEAVDAAAEDLPSCLYVYRVMPNQHKQHTQNKKERTLFHNECHRMRLWQTDDKIKCEHQKRELKLRSVTQSRSQFSTFSPSKDLIMEYSDPAHVSPDLTVLGSPDLLRTPPSTSLCLGRLARLGLPVAAVGRQDQNSCLEKKV